jgi:hypothetical protein
VGLVELFTGEIRFGTFVNAQAAKKVSKTEPRLTLLSQDVIAFRALHQSPDSATCFMA